nr:unnamed protein product [Callosobruchus chinensis]
MPTKKAHSRAIVAIIAEMHQDVDDLPIGRSVAEALRLIEAIQFVEEHGEVCPANWRKGQKTIKQDYFKSTYE